MLLLACALRATAQVSVEIVLEQEQFMRDESLRLKVRITNHSGQTLHLGKEKDWLTFAVETREGAAVPRVGDVPVEGEVSLESSQVGSRLVDLMPYYDLSRPGRYRVSAQLRIKEWGQEITSAPKEFDIIRGAKIWEQEFGVPAASGPPEVRKYALYQANNIKQLQLYLRLTDPSERTVFRVLSLGRLVSFSRPEAQVGKANELHTLFQTGARSFSYFIINPDGRVLSEQVYDYRETRPVLRRAENGRIVVAGGVHRVKPEELTLPPPAAGPTNADNTPKP